MAYYTIETDDKGKIKTAGTIEDVKAIARSVAPTGGGGGDGGARLVSGTVALSTADRALPPFVVATTTGATVEGVTLTAKQMAAFWYLDNAWHVMLHGQDSVWRSTAAPDTRTVVTPTAPTFTDNTTLGGGTWSTPTITGITYSPSSGTATAGQKVTVAASISDTTKYKMADGATTSWSWTFHAGPGPFSATDNFNDAADGSIVGRKTQTGDLTWAQGNGAAFIGGVATAPTVAGGKLVSGAAVASKGGIRRIKFDMDSSVGNKPTRVALGGGSPYPAVLIQDDAAYIFQGSTSLGSAPLGGSGGTIECEFRDGNVTVKRNGVQVITRAHAGTLGGTWGVWPEPAHGGIDNVEFSS